MQTIKHFFSITEDTYHFEIFDLTTLVTIANVALVLAGMWWAPFIGIANCAVCIGLNIRNRAHINSYVTQIALIVLNTYFLTL